MSDRIIIPDGKKTGCLPRATRVGQVCSLFSDKIPVIPSAEWSLLIGDVELRSCVTKIKDQDGVGSCATESTTQAVEIVRRFEGQPYVELNPWSIYWKTSGGRDQGSSIDENLEYVRENGICPESLWPRSNGWRNKPSDEAMAAAQDYRIEEFYDVTSILEAGTALLLGFPVVFGWQGHSCVLTQLLNTTTAEYANSWAPTWGDEGFGTVKLSSINFGYGMFALRTATVKQP